MNGENQWSKSENVCGVNLWMCCDREEWRRVEDENLIVMVVSETW